MGSPSFPVRKASGAGGMTSPQSSQLDGPPPSPAMPQGGPQLSPGQQPQMPDLSQLAQPLTAGTPGRAVAPEIAMGILQSAQTIASMFDSMASIVPDLAPDFALQKDLLQRTLAKLVTNAGTVAGAGSTGLNFPGGGFSAGAQ